MNIYSAYSQKKEHITTFIAKNKECQEILPVIGGLQSVCLLCGL